MFNKLVKQQYYSLTILKNTAPLFLICLLNNKKLTNLYLFISKFKANLLNYNIPVKNEFKFLTKKLNVILKSKTALSLPVNKSFFLLNVWESNTKTILNFISDFKNLKNKFTLSYSYLNKLYLSHKHIQNFVLQYDGKYNIYLLLHYFIKRSLVLLFK